MSDRIFHDWCNDNELRNYPLDDNATRLDDTGVTLPNDFLVDMNLRIPQSVGSWVFVSSASITSKLVSLTLSISTGPIVNGGAPTAIWSPLCVVSLVKPVDIFRNYPIEPLIEGVGGWVSFGGAINEQDALFLRFSDPSATLLAPHAVRWYDDLPVLSLGRAAFDTKLTGMVRFEGGSDIEIVKESRYIDGDDRDCVIFRLAEESQTQEKYVAYAGACGKRPESLNCPKTPFTTINGISPDCNGDIAIEIEGGVPYGIVYDDEGPIGLALEFPLGYVDVCQKWDDLSVREDVDLCSSSSSMIP